MELYTTQLSPMGKRVRIAAAELGIPLDIENLDFAASANRAPDYLALNPLGKVPTLVDGAFRLWESAAIMCYLARQKPGPIAPDDARSQADMLHWIFFCATHLDPYLTTLVLERFMKGQSGAPEDRAQTQAAEAMLARYVPVVEQQLDQRDYLTGSFTLADIALGCTLERAPRLRFDLAPYVQLRRWLDRLQSRPSWK